MATTQTCPRCKGQKVLKAYVTVYRGVPGLCYQCDGVGSVQKLTMKERVAKFAERCDKHMKQILEQAANLKTAYENRLAMRNERRAARGQEPLTLDYYPQYTRDMYSLRANWLDVNKQRKEAIKSGKVTTTQQPSTETIR